MNMFGCLWLLLSLFGVLYTGVGGEGVGRVGGEDVGVGGEDVGVGGEGVEGAVEELSCSFSPDCGIYRMCQDGQVIKEIFLLQ